MLEVGRRPLDETNSQKTEEKSLWKADNKTNIHPLPPTTHRAMWIFSGHFLYCFNCFVGVLGRQLKYQVSVINNSIL